MRRSQASGAGLFKRSGLHLTAAGHARIIVSSSIRSVTPVTEKRNAGAESVTEKRNALSNAERQRRYRERRKAGKT